MNKLIPTLQALLEAGRFDYDLAPAQIKEQYIRMSDSVGAFNMDCLVAEPEAVTAKDELYNAYADYCRRRNVPVADKASFTKRLFKYLEVVPCRPEINGVRVQALRGVRVVRVDSNNDDQAVAEPVTGQKVAVQIPLTYSNQNPNPSGMSTQTGHLSKLQELNREEKEEEEKLGIHKECQRVGRVVSSYRAGAGSG